MSKLQESTIAYNLGVGGVDQKTDDKFAPLGRPRELANVRFPKTGVVAKRYGLSPATAATTNKMQRLMELGDELLMVGKTSDGVRAWYSTVRAANGTQEGAANAIIGTKGTTVPPVPRAWVDNVSVVTQDTDEMRSPDVAVGLTMTCYVYRHVAGGAFYTIVDTATGRVINADVEFVSTTTDLIVRVLAVPNSNSFIVAAGTTTLTVKIVSPNTTTGAATTLATDTSITVNANVAWDWALFGSVLIIARRTSAATTVTVTKFTVSASALGSPSSGSAVTMTVGPVLVSVAAPYASTEDAIILASDATNGVRAFTVSTSTLAVVQSLWVVNAVTTTRSQLVGCRAASGNLWTYSELYDSTGYLTSVQSTNGAIGATPTAVIVNYSGFICSKSVITTASVSPFIVLGYYQMAPSGEQNTGNARFLYEGLVVVGQFLRGDVWVPPGSLSGGGVAGYNAVPNIAAFPSNSDLGQVVEYVTPSTRTVSLDAISGTIQCIAALRFNVHASSGYEMVQDENGALIQGGFLARYDGTNVAENGFMLSPDIISATASNGAGALPVNGSFVFVACYVRLDARGRLHRSAPSVPFPCTTGATDDTITVLVRPLRFTQNQYYGIELYRTEDDGTVFHMVELHASLAPSSATQAVSFTVLEADATLVTQKPLDQQAGILDNAQPVCPVAIASSGRRTLVVPGDDRYSVNQGKLHSEGDGIAFFDGVSKRITQDGDITALANLGDRWVAFKKRQLYIATGDGADDTAVQDTLSEFSRHPVSGVGCASQRALVKTSQGIVFKSEKGFYLLDQGGGLSFVGAGIEDYSSFPVVSSVFHADRNEVHFLLLDGPRLVLSFHETENGPGARWSIDEDHNDADSYDDIAVVGGILYAAPAERNSSDNYELFGENIGGYADQGSSYPVVIRVTTGWIPITGQQQGRGRLRSAKFLGTVKSVHTARVRAAYDYVDEWVDDKSVTSEDATNGGASADQWEFRPSDQKISAVKFEFTETLASAGQGLELNQILLSVGLQPGTKRLRSTQRASDT